MTTRQNAPSSKQMPSSGDSVAMAIWLIESNLTTGISLEEIAGTVGLSRFQLSRLFGRRIGLPVMGYLRARRLSEAAEVLAAGASDILTVALDAGYGSHEAFTRAFRDQFGLAPEDVRAMGNTQSIRLMEAHRMAQREFVDLEEPRFVTGPARLIAGISERYSFSDTAGIPLQWQRFGPHIGHVPDQRGMICYGVCYNHTENCQFDYLCGVGIARADDLPNGFTLVRLMEQTYAVFTHRGHISAIPQTISTIWQKWLPESGYQLIEAPDFELYDQRFDSQTGRGEVEIWLPIRR